jgi:antitoxin ParD1/3/4
LPKFANRRRLTTVGTMNISLPDELRDFVEEQVKRGYGTSSEYVRELIRRDQDRLRLRNLLLAGAASPPAALADESYFKRLRNRLQAERAAGRRR